VKNQEDITNGEEYNVSMIRKEVRAWCSKEMKNLSVVIWGERKKFSKISYLISFVRHTRRKRTTHQLFGGGVQRSTIILTD